MTDAIANTHLNRVDELDPALTESAGAAIGSLERGTSSPGVKADGFGVELAGAKDAGAGPGENESGVGTGAGESAGDGTGSKDGV